MIKYLLTAYLLLFSFYNQAQVCEIPNGDLEMWVDYSADLELPEGTLIAPEGFFSAIRFLEILFSGILEEVGVDIPKVASNLFGTKQSTDATKGQYALQFGADNLFAISDLISVGPCNGEQPTAFSFDLKHVGNVADTLLVFGVFGDKTGLPENEEEINEYSALFSQEILSDTSTEYQNISLPIADTGNEISADSFTIYMLLTSDEVSLSMGDTSYFLIDNIQFEGPNNTTSTKDFSLPSQVEVYPTVFQKNISINNDNDLLEAVVYSMSGQRKATLTIPKGQSQHDLSFITHSGSYLLKMLDPKTGRSVTKILVKK